MSQTIKIWNIQTDKVGYLDALLTMRCMHVGDLCNYNKLNQQGKFSYKAMQHNTMLQQIFMVPVDYLL